MITACGGMIQDAKRVLLISHRDPDGDALGSSLGLMHLLSARGKQVMVYSAGPLPDEYGFLPGMDGLLGELPSKDEVDLTVLLDCHQPGRAGDAARDWLDQGVRGAVIDHHLGEAEFGQAAWVDPSFAATSQMVELLAREMGWDLNPNAAVCLFVGLQTDTGSFQYSNTTPEVFDCAGRLVRAGAEPWPISQQVYATHPKRVAMLGRIMDRLQYLAKGRMVMAKVTKADMEQYGVDSRDLENAVEALRGIAGVEVAVLIREMNEGGVKASLRARGKYDVSQAALELGGGGHRNAAGFMSQVSIEEAAATLISMIAPKLEAA